VTTMPTGQPVRWAPQANGPLMARMIANGLDDHRTEVPDITLTWAFVAERVTGIEPALSAWELACHASVTGALQVSGHLRLSVSSRRVPALTPLSGTQRARQRSPHVGRDHLIRRDLHSHSLPVHSRADLAKCYSLMRNKWWR